MASFDRWRLPTWQNLTRTKPKSERREIDSAVIQVLVANYLQLDSLRCGHGKGGFLIVPDLRQLARQIQEAPDWAAVGVKVTHTRVFNALERLELCGYIKRSKRITRRRDDGQLIRGSRLITFTKKFFIELAGKSQSLWRDVKHALDERLANENPFTLQDETPLFITNHRQYKLMLSGKLLFPGDPPPLLLRAA